MSAMIQYEQLDFYADIGAWMGAMCENGVEREAALAIAGGLLCAREQYCRELRDLIKETGAFQSLWAMREMEAHAKVGG